MKYSYLLPTLLKQTSLFATNSFQIAQTVWQNFGNLWSFFKLCCFATLGIYWMIILTLIARWNWPMKARWCCLQLEKFETNTNSEKRTVLIVPSKNKMNFFQNYTSAWFNLTALPARWKINIDNFRKEQKYSSTGVIYRADWKYGYHCAEDNDETCLLCT